MASEAPLEVARNGPTAPPSPASGGRTMPRRRPFVLCLGVEFLVPSIGFPEKVFKNRFVNICQHCPKRYTLTRRIYSFKFKHNDGSKALRVDQGGFQIQVHPKPVVRSAIFRAMANSSTRTAMSSSASGGRVLSKMFLWDSECFSHPFQIQPDHLNSAEPCWHGQPLSKTHWEGRPAHSLSSKYSLK